MVLSSSSLVRQVPIDLLADAPAESFAVWLQAHPTVEISSRDRGTTYADGATRGASHAVQEADRWHLLHNLGEALEKVLAQHHADLKRAFNTEDEPEQPETPEPSVQGLTTQAISLSQAEQVQQARQQRRLATFAQVHELYAQGWSFASIARMLGMNKKTVHKFAQSEQFPESRPRSDRGRKLSPYLPYLHAQWATGEHNIAQLYQEIRAQGYRGSGTSVRSAPFVATRGNRPAQAASAIVSSHLTQEEARATDGCFQSSCHLVGAASTAGPLAGRPAHSRSRGASACPGESGLRAGTSRSGR